MSIKSLGKFAAIAAVAGLGLTACATGDAAEARQQEETCGLLQAANAKASDAMASMRTQDGPDERAAFTVESAALDLRNHSYDRSDNQPAPEGDETVQLRTALQAQAAYYEELSDTLSENVADAQNIGPEDVETNGMSLEDASGEIVTYCGQVFAQQQGPGGF